MIKLSREKRCLVYAGSSTNMDQSFSERHQKDIIACLDTLQDVCQDVAKDFLFALSINYLTRSMYDNALENLTVVPGLTGPTGCMCFLIWLYLSRNTYQTGRHKITFPS